ncbi:MAG: Holliday junction resolvase RecU [Solobacterium sp.]|nr:Holliday junction resolvase RecU [Solobacterium sp.]
MVNYPNGKQAVVTHTKASFADRGMGLEKDINITNQFYLSCDRAVIHKKPTPVTIVKVDYPQRSAARITEAYFKLPSTTDYNGIYRQKYIDFEAKECALLTSFPLKSIHAHQIEHLSSVCRHGAIAFLIVRFTKLNETYLSDAMTTINYIRTCGRRSIPYEWFQKNAYLIPQNYVKPVDYLSVVDRLYFKEAQ